MPVIPLSAQVVATLNGLMRLGPYVGLWLDGHLVQDH